MLNIAALGSKLFSVSGKERLSNEYGALRLLEEKDLAVQKVIHVSIPQRILIKEYINGITYLNIIKAYLDFDNRVNMPSGNPFLKRVFASPFFACKATIFPVHFRSPLGARAASLIDKRDFSSNNTLLPISLIGMTAIK